MFMLFELIDAQQGKLPLWAFAWEILGAFPSSLILLEPFLSLLLKFKLSSLIDLITDFDLPILAGNPFLLGIQRDWEGAHVLHVDLCWLLLLLSLDTLQLLHLSLELFTYEHLEFFLVQLHKFVCLCGSPCIFVEFGTLVLLHCDLSCTTLI